MSQRDGALLLIGSGPRRYREYLLASAAQRHPLWLFESREPTWQRRYVDGFTVADLHDLDDLLGHASKLVRERGVAGVLCYHEALIINAARVAACLNVPGITVEAARNCRDKSRTRAALTSAGIPQPRFALAANIQEATRAAKGIGYPLVIKPRGLGASQGVVKVTDEEQLAAGFAFSRSARRPEMEDYETVLIEEYLDGPEVSVDAVVHNGVCKSLFLASKSIGPEPYFEEVGHVVSADDPLLDDGSIRANLAAAHAALGIRNAITHTEFRLTRAGPVIVEVNGRLGGDLIPYLGFLATGVDPGQVAVDLSLGRQPTLRPTRAMSAGIRFLVPERDCRVRSVAVPPAGGTVHAAEVLAEPGTELRLPPRGFFARYALVIATADDPASCASRLDDAARGTRLEYDPLPR